MTEKIFFDKYTEAEKSYREIQTLQGFYNAVPPYFIEMLIVCALLLLACILSAQNASSNSSLVASFAIVIAALFRIAPALNRIQTSIININSTRDFVKKINEEYESCNLGNFEIFDSSLNEKIDFKGKIILKNICFSYNPAKQVLKNISFDINKGDFIGIIGLSGAGKSTLADILTGLLPADSGQILVDGIKLSQHNFHKFRHIIGYVPQQINILDKSFKENVAWGCDKINDERVIKALKAAQLYDVISEYTEGINSNIIIGSNGLSQGQKQRLAIARALYRDPQILIFDEATSALDVQVESEITEMLKTITDRGVRLAVASNKYQDGAEKLVSHFFGEYDFVKILGQRDGQPIKPDPAIVDQILADVPKVAKEQVVYVGDSNVDMQTGANAQVRTIGVTWGFRSKEELAAYTPSAIVDTPEILSKVILEG